MSADIDNTLGFDAMAFAGKRRDIWHRLGQEASPDWNLDDWIRNAGLNWTAGKVPAFAEINGAMSEVDNAYFINRSDTGKLITSNSVSDQYRLHQPREVIESIDQFAGAHDDFKFSTMGALRGGAIIWGLVEYRNAMRVAGEAHQAYLLASTSFDGTAATTLRKCLTRVVCANTIAIALGEGGDTVIRIRHSTKFNRDNAAKQLADAVKQFGAFAKMGDAMAQVVMTREEVSKFFKTLLDIPFDAQKDDISTRKQNQFQDLSRAWRRSVDEGAPTDTAWSALQAVTRYVDHDRATRGGESEMEARAMSAQFGSGAAMKQEALAYLMPLVKERVAA